MPPRRLLWLALAVAAAARLPALLLGMEHYGDGPVRVEIAERWALAPHLWRGLFAKHPLRPPPLRPPGGAPPLLARPARGARALSLPSRLLCVWLLLPL